MKTSKHTTELISTTVLKTFVTTLFEIRNTLAIGFKCLNPTFEDFNFFFIFV